MQNSFSKAATVYMIILVISAWLAPAVQLYILLHNVPGNGLTYLQARSFSTILYHTYQPAGCYFYYINSLRPAIHMGTVLFKTQFSHRRSTLHFYCRSCIQYYFAQHLGTGWPAKMGG